ncbi:glycosyltransferase [Nocardioides sp. B-3]|uniref:glycosyltransferase n=1 Tax=Nocardioides sp. B-3 TaxID=2895565 RepID=UPI002152F749|nr:glycosyltransferase [Nocardioides sp. B-3]UUZ58091.1 glycosyltransferase [Nocardioides sp. B-3]
MAHGPDRRVVAVVVTFNRLALVQRLIERLGEVDGLHEVLVVDNASTDGTGARLAGTPTTGEIPVLGRTLERNRGRRRRVPRRARSGHRPRRRPRLADGRRRPPPTATASGSCSSTTTTSGARSSWTRTTARPSSSRSARPAAPPPCARSRRPGRRRATACWSTSSSPSTGSS